MKIRIENKYINQKSNSKYIKVNQLYVKKKMINNKILQKNAEDLKTNIIKLDARLNVIPYINKYHNRYFKKKGSELSPKSYTDGNKKFNPNIEFKWSSPCSTKFNQLGFFTLLNFDGHIPYIFYSQVPSIFGETYAFQFFRNLDNIRMIAHSHAFCHIKETPQAVKIGKQKVNVLYRRVYFINSTCNFDCRHNWFIYTFQD